MYIKAIHMCYVKSAAYCAEWQGNFEETKKGQAQDHKPTFEAFFINNNGIVLRSLSQTEEFTPGEEEDRETQQMGSVCT